MGERARKWTGQWPGRPPCMGNVSCNLTPRDSSKLQLNVSCVGVIPVTDHISVYNFHNTDELCFREKIARPRKSQYWGGSANCLSLQPISSFSFPLRVELLLRSLPARHHLFSCQSRRLLFLINRCHVPWYRGHDH